MTPIFIGWGGGAWFVGREKFRSCARWIHALRLRFLRSRGFLILRFLRFRCFLFAGRFEVLGELHRADEQAGEKAAAQEGVAEKFPGLHRGFARADAQGGEPAGEIAGVFGVGEGVEEPRGGVGDDVKKDRAEHASAKERQPGLTGLETASEPDEEQIDGVVQQLIELKGIDVFREIIIAVDGQIGCGRHRQRQPPAASVAEINTRAEKQRIDGAEVMRHEAGPARRGENQQQRDGQPDIDLFFHGAE